MKRGNFTKNLQQAAMFACCAIVVTPSLATQNDSFQSQPPTQVTPSITQPATIDQFRIHGLSAFSVNEQDILRQWLRVGVNATRKTLGIYPRALELYVYPKKSNQPVPWAHTRRDQHESIHFYVDTQFSLDIFIADWTGYHEMAHLAIPFVGEDYAWFSEGFASYMQYQIMAQSDILKLPIEQAYKNKISPQLKWFQGNDSAAVIAMKLMKKHNFPAAYWGGAWFFVLAERQLQSKHNISLIQVISQYQQAGRHEDDNIQALLTSLDKLIHDSMFSDLLKQFEQVPASSLYPTTLN
ncbi:hypothetical protein [Paraglaciecola sp.]|uniref:hypothetical protein n=1 Tax=Paraglaciecola sp. TaxID=1920173 RepID=UPI0030F3D52C